MGISSGDCLDYLKRDDPPTIGGTIRSEEGKSEENQNKNNYACIISFLSASRLSMHCDSLSSFSFFLHFPAIIDIFSETLSSNKSFSPSFFCQNILSQQLEQNKYRMQTHVYSRYQLLFGETALNSGFGVTKTLRKTSKESCHGKGSLLDP